MEEKGQYQLNFKQKKKIILLTCSVTLEMAFDIHQPLFGLFSFDVFTLPRKQMIHMHFEQLI